MRPLGLKDCTCRRLCTDCYESGSQQEAVQKAVKTAVKAVRTGDEHCNSRSAALPCISALQSNIPTLSRGFSSKRRTEWQHCTCVCSSTDVPAGCLAQRHTSKLSIQGSTGVT